MGEANQRKSFTQRTLSENPFCIYCGGAEPAQDIDHVPPISIFDGRLRPREPVFSVCKPCHEGTRITDSIAATLSRINMSPETDAQREDIKRVVKATVRHHRDVANELGLDNVVDDGRPSALNVGPLLHSHMQRFAARMGFALHHLTTGKAIRASGGVFVRWYSNFDALTGNLPDELLAAMGPDRTLQQGSFHVANQFQYCFTSDGLRYGFFCSFRNAFATLSISFGDSSELPFASGPMPPSIFRPGFLRAPVP